MAEIHAKLMADFVVTEEAKATDKTTGNISLMSITDYCSSFESDKELNCMSSAMVNLLINIGGVGGETIDTSFLGLTWLTPSMDIGYEWTMSRIGYGRGSIEGWSVYANGIVQNYFVSNQYDARPVFYLTSDINLSGEGTIDNPFTIGIE